MDVLFIHQNFPAQFRCIAPRLANDHRWRVTFATANGRAPALRGVERVLYRPRGGATALTHFAARRFENTTGHAHGVYEAMKARPDLRPDLVVAHSGFGSSLFMPQLYDAPVINFFEYFFLPVGQDLGYLPDTAVTETQLLRWRTLNANLLLDLDNCDRGWSPNIHQRSVFPEELRLKIEVIPEGIDTDLYRRRSDALRVLPDGTAIPAGTRVVTYVSRGFERMRGFDVFMKAAKRIYRQFPDVLFVCVGSDRVCYGDPTERGAYRTYRERALAEGDYDLSKFRFVGRVDEAALAGLLSVSDLHIYLTVPFITSWSMLDAMSCGCVVLASDQACTREYITHGRNGLLCGFFDDEGIAEAAVRVLRDPAAHQPLGEAARATIEEKYSVDVCLPRIKAMFEEVAANGPRTPSMRTAAVCREGRRPATQPPATVSERPRFDDLPPYDGSIPFRVDGRRVKWTMPERAGAPTEPKTVLFCWELGAGLGHLMQMRPLAEDLARAGHRVLVAARDLAAAARVLGGAGVTFLPAAFRLGMRVRFPRPLNFTQLLANLGWTDDFELFGVACTLRNLIISVQPDLVVFDHSPTALLASRGLPLRRALIGSGFCCPPDESPFPLFRPQMRGRAGVDALPAFEETVLACVNRRLRDWGEPPLERLAQLYAEVDENFLTTFPELDHYPGRAAAYWGPVLADELDENEPQWPDGAGGRVFAYLKSFPGLPAVLAGLCEAARPTVAYVDGAAPALRRRFECATLRIESEPLDLRRAARECDVAVLNGGHGATAEMLLAGKPVVQIPLTLEQRLTADAASSLGAGAALAGATPGPVRAATCRLLDESQYPMAARRFAIRYAAYDPPRQRAGSVGRAVAMMLG